MQSPYSSPENPILVLTDPILCASLFEECGPIGDQDLCAYPSLASAWAVRGLCRGSRFIALRFVGIGLSGECSVIFSSQIRAWGNAIEMQGAYLGSVG